MRSGASAPSSGAYSEKGPGVEATAGPFDEHARRQKLTNTVTSSRRGGAYPVGRP